jgi:DNA-binding transcriptional ArsR family regulator
MVGHFLARAPENSGALRRTLTEPLNIRQVLDCTNPQALWLCTPIRPKTPTLELPDSRRAPWLQHELDGLIFPVNLRVVMTGINCIAALKALGELSRMRIIRLLLQRQMGVCQIARKLKMSQYNVSKHLRILKEAGLLDMEKQGKQRLYTVIPHLKNHLAANANVLELDCCTFRFDKLPK